MRKRMIYYHVTDYWLYERILCEGLLGNPVVYVTTSEKSALAIRQCQINLREKFGGCVLLKITYQGDVFVDPHTRPLGAAWMIYDDIPPQHIQVYWH